MRQWWVRGACSGPLWVKKWPVEHSYVATWLSCREHLRLYGGRCKSACTRGKRTVKHRKTSSCIFPWEIMCPMLAECWSLLLPKPSSYWKRPRRQAAIGGLPRTLNEHILYSTWLAHPPIQAMLPGYSKSNSRPDICGNITITFCQLVLLRRRSFALFKIKWG